MRCWFCFAEGEVPRLSKEHLLSEPVSSAFGLNRSGSFGQIDGTNGSITLARLDTVAVKMVCKRCNNTWMNDLEHDFAALASWCHARDRGLASNEVDCVRAWCLKTYLVLSVMVGGTRRFAETPEAPGVIPDFPRARQLYAKARNVFDGMAFGLSRPYERGQFAYAFGNPTVVPQGPRYASRKSAGLAIVSLGLLQVWVVDPILPGARTTFPKQVVSPSPDLTYGGLRGTPLLPELDDVVVDNGEHDIVEVFAQLENSVGKQRPD